MRALLDKAQSLADTLWNSETENKDFSTPERRAGLEATLETLTKSIRDAKVADYYRRDFSDRIFKAFKQRQRPEPRRPQQGGQRPGAGTSATRGAAMGAGGTDPALSRTPFRRR